MTYSDNGFIGLPAEVMGGILMENTYYRTTTHHGRQSKWLSDKIDKFSPVLPVWFWCFAKLIGHCKA